MTNELALPFAAKLIPLIHDGSKRMTFRFGGKYKNYTPGSIVGIRNSETREIVAKARITKNEPTTFKDLPLDVDGHEAYPDKETQRQVFSRYYAYLEREIQDNDPFLVIEFEVLPRDKEK